MERTDIIKKTPSDLKVPPNFTDYEAERASFSWDGARRELSGLPGGGLNIAWEAVERHAKGELANRAAFRFLGVDRSREITYAELSRLSNRFANVLKNLGVGKGDRVYTLLGRTQALYVAVMGSFKNGSVVSPLFSAFGPEPIATRLNLGDARVLVTTELQYKRKLANLRDRLPNLKHVLIVGED